MLFSTDLNLIFFILQQNKVRALFQSQKLDRILEILAKIQGHQVKLKTRMDLHC